jgi:hypothetical protein
MWKYCYLTHPSWHYARGSCLLLRLVAHLCEHSLSEDLDDGMVFSDQVILKLFFCPGLGSMDVTMATKELTTASCS